MKKKNTTFMLTVLITTLVFTIISNIISFQSISTFDNRIVDIPALVLDNRLQAVKKSASSESVSNVILYANASSGDISDAADGNVNHTSTLVPRLALGSTMRNEAPYLKEWIEFHLARGVDKFYIADNDSTDDSLNVLDMYVTNGIVELVPFQNNDQVKTYNEILKFAKGDRADWLCIMDIDAFIFPREKRDSLVKLLSGYHNNVGAVGVSILNFDHNGHEKMEELPLIERFTHRMTHTRPFNGAYSRSFTLYRVQDTIRTGIHNPSKLAPGKVFVDVNGKQMRLSPYMHGKDVVAPHNGTIMLNHYYCKSHEEFKKKNSRNIAWDNKESSWDDRCARPWTNNGVTDTTIQQYVSSDTRLF